MKMQGNRMVDALYFDLKQVKQLNITIGKQRIGETALDFFSDIIPKIDLVWVIAPESNSELERFHIASKKKLWIGSDLQAIRLASNKLETKKYLKSLSINTPDEITFDSLRKKSYIEAVYKPIDGAGTTDTYKIENKKNYRGEIFGFQEDYLLLTDAKSTEVNNKVKIPIQNINKAKLVFSDKLLKLQIGE